MAFGREEYLWMAKLAAQAERWEEVAEYMRKMCNAVGGEELTAKEKKLLSVAYKNVIEARRASWRIISSIEQKEESLGNEDHVALTRSYRAVIELEITKICVGFLKLLLSRLVPSAASGESKAFFRKMIGEYYAYLAEFKQAVVSITGHDPTQVVLAGDVGVGSDEGVSAGG